MKDIDQIVSQLSLEEKVSLLSGFNSWYTNKINHANIPSIKMSDGPNGIRGDSNSGKSSACFPCAISIGSTWDLELINQLGEALGEEANAKVTMKLFRINDLLVLKDKLKRCPNNV